MPCGIISTDPKDILTAVGLLLDIVGIVVLFSCAPEKDPDPQSRAGFKIEDELRRRWEIDQRSRRWWARVSIAMIILGFGLQIIAALFL